MSTWASARGRPASSSPEEVSAGAADPFRRTARLPGARHARGAGRPCRLCHLGPLRGPVAPVAQVSPLSPFSLRTLSAIGRRSIRCAAGPGRTRCRRRAGPTSAPCCRRLAEPHAGPGRKPRNRVHLHAVAWGPCGSRRTRSASAAAARR
jgi:hypothetical protein